MASNRRNVVHVPSMNIKTASGVSDPALKLLQAHSICIVHINTGDKRERRKRQNLLNQRASRWRRQQEKANSSRDTPYRVHRWRIGEPEYDISSASGHMTSIATEDFINSSDSEQLDGYDDQAVVQDHSKDVCLPSASVQSQTSTSGSSPKLYTPPSDENAKITPLSTHVNLPLSSDHILIQLIHHNAFRALTTNKAILRYNTSLMKTYPQPENVGHSLTNICDGFTIIHAVPNRDLPDSLRPTQPQMSIAHSSWMNMFPFPKFRDNLIRESRSTDLGALLYDLFGDLYYSQNKKTEAEAYPVPAALAMLSPSALSAGLDDDSEYNDDISAGRRCLIVWGDPWVVDNWEATPGFLQRWGWLMQGCFDLVAASNRWRALRHEDPLHFES